MYGTSAHTAEELAGLVADHLGVVFTERDSDYRGIYHLADTPDGRIEIQPNHIPGDADEDDLYAEDHPWAQTLLLTETPTATSALHARLGLVDGLVHLGHETA